MPSALYGCVLFVLMVPKQLHHMPLLCVEGCFSDLDWLCACLLHSKGSWAPANSEPWL